MSPFKEVFTISVMIGDSADRTSLRSRVGIGLREHEALEAF